MKSVKGIKRRIYGKEKDGEEGTQDTRTLTSLGYLSALQVYIQLRNKCKYLLEVCRRQARLLQQP